MRKLVAALVSIIALPVLMAAWTDYERPLPALYEVEARVGIVQIDIDERVQRAAPEDFADIRAKLTSAATAYLQARGGEAVDYTDLGFQAKIESSEEITLSALKDEGVAGAVSEASKPYHVRAVEGLPAGVETPLVTVFKVLSWRTGQEKYGEAGKSRPTARVEVLASTWTVEGEEVLSQWVTVSMGASAIAESGRQSIEAIPGLGATTGAGGAAVGRLQQWYLSSDGREPVSAFHKAPEDRVALMELAIGDAVGAHYFALTDHQIMQKDWVLGKKDNKPGMKLAKGGEWQAAHDAWATLPATAETLYNLGIARFALGRSDEARATLKEAEALGGGGGKWAKQKLKALENEQQVYDAVRR